MIDPQIKRELQDLRAGRMEAAGSFTLSVAPATSTSVEVRSCSASSHVSTQATSATAANTDITRVTPSKSLFVVTHGASSVSSRTHSYAIFTPI